MITITIEEIAKITQAIVVGDKDAQVTGMVHPEHAGEGDITFALNEEQLEMARNTEAVGVIVPFEVKEYPKTTLQVADMKTAITILYNVIIARGLPEKGNVHLDSTVHETASLGENVAVGAHAVIGESAVIGNNAVIGENTVVGKGVSIGEKTTIYPNVSIYDRTVIGSKVIIHSGSVIGSDGFGFIPKDGQVLKVPQMGKVIIKDNVEIGANSCIDRGTFDSTIIEEGAKIDNLVQIAHNVKIGKNVLMAALTGIAGSSILGDNTMMGGQSGVADHVKVGKNVQIGAGSAVFPGTVQDNAAILGYPARDGRRFFKEKAFLGWLTKNSKKIKDIVRNT
jgi:UDP-3-O-[3-hydroxymyristoyl] glucosamine N-acyltransferase